MKPGHRWRAVVDEVDRDAEPRGETAVGEWFGHLLAHPRWPWGLGLLVLLLLAPGMRSGLLLDDHAHAIALRGSPAPVELHRGPAELFDFVRDDEHRRQLVEKGLWPWWTGSDLRIAFLRPLASWSHALDHRLWAERPVWMHLHSALWMALAVVVLTFLYRRLLPGAAMGGLAGLLVALDDSQTLPALWLANRNSVLALALGAGCLWAHDRWRRDAWAPGAVLAPLALGAAVLSNEGAVAIGAYLLGYALFLERGALTTRLASLAPATAVGIVWALVYRFGGYGAIGSGVYVDPLGDPARFALLALERIPILVWGWWVFPPAEVDIMLSGPVRGLVRGVQIAFLPLLALALWPVLRRERVARALAFGTVLSLVPAAATFPANRLLPFFGIGAAGLLAMVVVHLWEGRRELRGARRLAVSSLLAGIALVHGVLAPALFLPSLGQMEELEALVRSTAASSPDLAEPGVTDRIVLFTPAAYLSLVATLVAWEEDLPRPERTWILASGLGGAQIERLDPRTLRIRPVGGFFRAPEDPIVEGETHAVDPRRVFLLLEHLFRDLESDPLPAGTSVHTRAYRAKVAESEAGRPLAVDFVFAEPLTRPRWSFVRWAGGSYESVALPPEGETVTLPGVGTP